VALFNERVCGAIKSGASACLSASPLFSRGGPSFETVFKENVLAQEIKEEKKRRANFG
jgi:hypothetical protein